MEAYTSTGKQINLPKAGKKSLQAGTIIRDGNEFYTLTEDKVYSRSISVCNLTQSRKEKEELI